VHRIEIQSLVSVASKVIFLSDLIRFKVLKIYCTDFHPPEAWTSLQQPTGGVSGRDRAPAASSGRFGTQRN
jgi:hypothetical protein